MKPMIAYFAVASLALALPGAAQTNAVPGPPSPQQLQLLQAARSLRVMSGPRPLNPQEKARVAAGLATTNALDQAAAEELHQGNYVQAEADARQSISISPSGVSEEVLASALDAQDKDKEALTQYQTVVEHYDLQPRNLLPYAQLLLKSGQWAEAVALYNQVLPHLPDVGSHPEIPTVHDGDVIRANSHFSPDVPEPAALATALHIARGMIYNATTGWAGDSLDKEAMAECAKALQSAPDNALANYYYGVGWQNLSLTDRAKFGNAEQAKAALQKAVKIGNADVKQAAERALKNAG
jgi:tetratricopeptide (TPR) repeat protein